MLAGLRGRGTYHSHANRQFYNLIQEDAGTSMVSLPSNQRHNARVMHNLGRVSLPCRHWCCRPSIPVDGKWSCYLCSMVVAAGSGRAVGWEGGWMGCKEGNEEYRHTRIRAEFWNVSCERVSTQISPRRKLVHTVARERCFKETPPRVPEGDRVTMLAVCDCILKLLKNWRL